MKIKEDHMFTLHCDPKLVQKVILPEGVDYIEKVSGKKVKGVFKLYEYLYDSEGRRLDTPFIPSYELVSNE